MKRIFFLMFICPIIFNGQNTYIPDDSFEQELINLGLDDILNDSVSTSAIDTVKYLYISNMGISDLTGIEDFNSLLDLFCHDNQIQNLDLSYNTNLFEINCNNNQLLSLSVKNGNSSGLWYFTAINNPNLLCVEVDNINWANYSWQIDNTAVFSTNCSPISSVSQLNYNRKLKTIIDTYGNEVIMINHNSTFIYIYDDGSSKKINILK